MPDDQQLLHRYIGEGTDAAFSGLVARHLNLVYSAALRRTNGNVEMAKDASQVVFADLARKAHWLPKNVVLTGWLYRATRFAAERLLRAERRGRAREREAVEMNTFQPESEPDWGQIRPFLDAELDRLSRPDRDALLLRFFEERSLAEVGKALGLSEEAARKRVARGLEKVRTTLLRRGITTTASALAAAISGNAVQVAPAGLAASLAPASLAGAAVGAGATLTFLKSIAMTKLQASIIGGLAVISVAAPLAIHYQSQADLRAKEGLLRNQEQQLSALAAENERLSNAVAREPHAAIPTNQNTDELLRLRGEVGVLRTQLAEADRARSDLERQATEAKEKKTAALSPQEQARRRLGMASMNAAAHWVRAMLGYATQDHGYLPATLFQAAPFLAQDHRGEALQSGSDFQVVYHGSLQALTNTGIQTVAVRNPADVIVLREAQAHQNPDGTWSRTYAFADGHSEIPNVRDGNFARWEQQRAARSWRAKAPIDSSGSSLGGH
jgi:RNA polymerase sigma factor (sigma-70 family)